MHYLKKKNLKKIRQTKLTHINKYCMHSGIILAQEDSAPLYEIFLGNIRHHTVHRFPHMKGLI